MTTDELIDHLAGLKGFWPEAALDHICVLIAERGEARAEVARLTAARDEEDRNIAAMVRRLNTAEAEVERLRAALRVLRTLGIAWAALTADEQRIVNAALATEDTP